MDSVSRNTLREGDEYRLQDHTGEHTIYDALPFDVDGAVSWYPEGEVGPATSEEEWKQLVIAEAGVDGEIEGAVYVLPGEEGLALLRFEDPDRAVAMVAERHVARQVTGTMLTSEEWAVDYLHGWLEEAVYEAVVDVFKGL